MNEERIINVRKSGYMAEKVEQRKPAADASSRMIEQKVVGEPMRRIRVAGELRPNALEQRSREQFCIDSTLSGTAYEPGGAVEIAKAGEQLGICMEKMPVDGHVGDDTVID